MPRRPSHPLAERSRHFHPASFFTWLLGASLFLFAPVADAPAQTAPFASSDVTIVLPPKVVAGQQATLAVLGAHGKLAAGVTVKLENIFTEMFTLASPPGATNEPENPSSVRTDRTGRGFFGVFPVSGALLASTASDYAAALVGDFAPPVNTPQAITVAPVVSLHNYFSICGAGFAGDADENRVNINGAAALVLAASPECLVVLPGADAAPGPATISVEAAGQKRTAATSLVSLAFESPNPALLPDQRGRLTVRVLGSELPLRIVVENKTPDVLRFLRGDEQDVVTRGGAQNIATIEVQAIRSGDFSLSARIRAQPDPEAAGRYLWVAVQLAPESMRDEIWKLSRKLAHHPRDFRPLRLKLDEILAATPPGDFRTLLRAARATL